MEKNKGKRKIVRLTESDIHNMVMNAINEIVGPSDKYSRATNAFYAASKSKMDAQQKSFRSMGRECIKKGLEKSHLRDRWNNKYKEIGEMDEHGNIRLTEEWAERLGLNIRQGEGIIPVHAFGRAPEDHTIATNNEWRRRLAQWDANGVLPKGAVMLLAKIQEVI